MLSQVATPTGHAHGHEDRSLDITNFTDGNVDDASKFQLNQERCPNYWIQESSLESSRTKRIQGGVMNRYCQKLVRHTQVQVPDILDCNTWSTQPFGQTPVHQLEGRAMSDVQEHAGKCEYHKMTQAKVTAFVETMQNPGRRIDLPMSSQSADRVETYRAFLPCGRQGLALRGHRTADGPFSYKGNFHVLLQLRVDAADVALKDHQDTCSQRNDDSPKPMGTHITGAISHGVSKIYAAIDIQNIPHDSNLTITVLMKVLQDEAQVKHVSSDNTTDVTEHPW
ncbi:hypothetical protein Bbelb_109690 [Branchiostoma belcheri]|nr:hypothetical protein Bbelb_109690 [Branchiostoma belcheri]